MFRSVFVSKPSLRENEAKASTVVYLINQDNCMKLYGLRGEKVEHITSVDLSAYQIICLVKNQDTVLLQSLKEKEKFHIYSPFENTILAEVNLFSESFQMGFEGS